jgi:hypothetical protein
MKSSIGCRKQGLDHQLSVAGLLRLAIWNWAKRPKTSDRQLGAYRALIRGNVATAWLAGKAIASTKFVDSPSSWRTRGGKVHFPEVSSAIG